MGGGPMLHLEEKYDRLLERVRKLDEEHAKALSAARAEGRREGFEKAREMAAGKADATATHCMHGSRGRAVAEEIRDDIRAMQDGRGEAAKPDDGGRLCDCTGVPHRAEKDCP